MANNGASSTVYAYNRGARLRYNHLDLPTKRKTAKARSAHLEARTAVCTICGGKALYRPFIAGRFQGRCSKHKINSDRSYY